MKINIDVPDHITRCEIDASADTTIISLTSFPAKHHVRIEKEIMTANIRYNSYYLQSIVNEIAEALR